MWFHLYVGVFQKAILKLERVHPVELQEEARHRHGKERVGFKSSSFQMGEEKGEVSKVRGPGIMALVKRETFCVEYC